jgi:hypothetical protein
MSKRTPGPWVITHSPLNGYRVSDKTGWGVAVVLKDTNDEANARLIAAAPRMLEALERLSNAATAVSQQRHDNPDPVLMFVAIGEMLSAIRQADEAIKAAKGEI